MVELKKPDYPAKKAEVCVEIADHASAEKIQSSLTGIMRRHHLDVVECTLNSKTGTSSGPANLLRRACVITLPEDQVFQLARKHRIPKRLKDKSLEPYPINFALEAADLFEGYEKGPYGLFSTGEQAYIIFSVLDNLRHDDTFCEEMGDALYPRAKVTNDLVLLNLQSLGLVESVFPLHTKVHRGKLAKHIMTSRFSMHLDEIRDYFGDEVAIYFAFMQSYCRWLMLPALVGPVVSFLGGAPADNVFLPLFSAGMALYGVIFLKFWNRESRRASLEWGSLNVYRRERVRPSYFGEKGTSAVTGEAVLVYPSWKRALRQFASLLATLPFISAVGVIMVMSLNLQGYITSPTSPFYFPKLAALAQKGAIFDPDSDLMAFVPPIGHAIFIQILNITYRKFSVKLTEWENYRTEEQFMNAVLIKRFLFEAMDCYLPLLYIAFYQVNIVRLRTELVSLFITDQGRRFVTELVLPLIMERTARKLGERELRKEFAAGDHKKDDDVAKEINRTDADDLRQRVYRNLLADEYEAFDDYLEMVIQFGYVTLFAAAFPFGGLAALLANLIEVRQDMTKLLYAVRRPRPNLVPDIGSWMPLLSITAALAQFTNSYIFAFGNKYVDDWYESLYAYIEGTDDAEKDIKLATTVVFFVEHTLIVVAAALAFTIPDNPEEVEVALLRREHNAEREHMRLHQVTA
eukprot:Clim_evm8s78 gene=Clim_evmTU8s78